MTVQPECKSELPEVPLSGTEAQVEWALRIRTMVEADFNRVANAFHAAAERQSRIRRDETYAILAILEEKRAEVMRIERAGYFIKEWQEISDQVRKLIFADPRYEAIQLRRAARLNPAHK